MIPRYESIQETIETWLRREGAYFVPVYPGAPNFVPAHDPSRFPSDCWAAMVQMGERKAMLFINDFADGAHVVLQVEQLLKILQQAEQGRQRDLRELEKLYKL